MRIVIALGGNALLRRGDTPDAEPQRARITRAARPLAELARQHDVVIVHGNGPQVGLLALESATDHALTRPYPLSDLVAETQGLIGYWLQQALSRHLDKPVVSLVTQTMVDAEDSAFDQPTKPVGSVYADADAEALAAQHGWTFTADGDGRRRTVASPLPITVVETDTADLLLRHGVTVVVAGGGGIPVIDGPDGLRGVEAVVDKDLVASHLAEALGADMLLILTDVHAVMAGFGTPEERPLHEVTVSELSHLSFAAGSMGPKVEAVLGFVGSVGKRAAIGSLDDARAVFAGTDGTQVRP
jgi:carbamate kinase